MNTERKFTSKFKAEVVLELLRERSSLAELAQKYEIAPQQLSNWKQEFLGHAEDVFEKSAKNMKDLSDEYKDLLLQIIGKLIGERDYLNEATRCKAFEKLSDKNKLERLLTPSLTESNNVIDRRSFERLNNYIEVNPIGKSINALPSTFSGSIVLPSRGLVGGIYDFNLAVTSTMKSTNIKVNVEGCVENYNKIEIFRRKDLIMWGNAICLLQNLLNDGKAVIVIEGNLCFMRVD